MKRFIYILILMVSTFHMQSQCFQIQSILVDACAGSQEGQNEMVTFQVGSSALNSANLSVNWPNNSWLGLAKNAGTAADVATVNSTISGCGLLKEPISGVLPANSKVLLVSSTAWTPLAQSFVNLSDTLYVIFQAAGNTNGHFANYQAGGGLRTLSMTFSSPASCNDVVTYDRALLTNQAGSIGGQDGGAVEFSASGTPTYVNHGCQAPFIALSVDAGPNKTVCSGSTQSFTATTSGVYSSVSWSLGAGANGTFAPTNSLSTVYSPGMGESGTVKLYCTIIKACGTQTTTVKDSVNLTILQIPNPVISSTTNTLCSGNSATLSYSLTNAANTGTTSVLWFPGNANTPAISVNSANIYTVQISNLCGNKTATTSITSIPNPTVTLSATTFTACAGGTVAISATSNTGNYSWTNPVSTNSAVVVSANTSTTGVVSTTNTCGTDTKSYTVTVIDTPTISVDNSNVSLCAGQSVTITAFSNAATYTWSPGGITTNSIVLNSAGIYTVNTSNLCGNVSATVNVSTSSAPTLTIVSSVISICPSGQTATLSLSGSTGTYTWSTGVNTPTALINSPGVYSATVSTPGCGNTVANISLSSAPLPIVSISAPATTSLCPGGSIILTASSSEGNYLWSNGATTNTVSATNPSVTVTSTNACGSAQATQTLNVIPTPTVLISPTSTVICPGSSATLTANSNAGNYIWSTGDITSVISANTPGVKTVTVTNACGTATASSTISNVSFPPLTLTSSSNTICPNETATLTVSGGVPLTSGAPVLYSWSNSSDPDSVVTTNGGIVSVSNTNVCGINTQTINVSVVNLNASISANPVIGTSPLNVSFTSNSSNATTYIWNFGNGNTANAQTVSNQIYYTGIYTAYLTVTNGVCSDIDTVIITVMEEEPSLYIPNAFTPNGDSINDIFLVGATNIKEFHIIIFDRWGLELFESSDILKGWDGRVNGKEVSDGCYFHLITAKGNDEKEIKKQGTITLFK